MKEYRVVFYRRFLVFAALLFLGLQILPTYAYSSIVNEEYNATISAFYQSAYSDDKSKLDTWNFYWDETIVDKAFPKFDPGLGTLQKVTIMYQVYLTSGLLKATFRDDSWASAVDGYVTLTHPVLRFNIYPDLDFPGSYWEVDGENPYVGFTEQAHGWSLVGPSHCSTEVHIWDGDTMKLH